MAYCFIILYYLLLIYNVILIIGVILTWIPNLLKFWPFQIIRKLASCFLEPFSGYIEIGSIDFSTLIAFFVYSYIVNTFTTLIPF